MSNDDFGSPTLQALAADDKRIMANDLPEAPLKRYFSIPGYHILLVCFQLKLLVNSYSLYTPWSLGVRM